MNKAWRKALRQWNEPEAAGNTRHEPGDVYQIDIDTVLDDDILLQQGVHVAVDAPTETPSFDGTTRRFKADKTTTPPADPPVQEDKVNG